MIIKLPWQRPPLTLNDGGHARHKAAAIKQARADAGWTIRAANLTPIEHADKVTLHWQLPDRLRRDADGMTATLKPCLDALVDQGILKDDSWLYVAETSCRMHPPTTDRRSYMWLEVTPRKEVTL